MSAKKQLPKTVQKMIKGNNYKPTFLSEEEKYSKAKFIHVYKGYDFLENLYTIRTFIQKKYDLDFKTLELLLKLMGLRVFNREMFAEVPKYFEYRNWNSFLDMGFTNMVMDHADTDQRLYCLNTKARNIVIRFYEYLSGEKKIPEESKFNPLANKNTSVAFDKKKLEMIKKLNQLDPKEHTKYLFG